MIFWWNCNFLVLVVVQDMVAAKGFEPLTFGLWAQRANRCSKLRYKWGSWRESNPRIIAPQATVLNHFTTTTKKVFKNLVTYKISQMAAPVGFEPTDGGTKIRCLSAWLRGNNGGKRGIWTPELMMRSGLQPPAFGQTLLSSQKELNLL